MKRVRVILFTGLFLLLMACSQTLKEGAVIAVGNRSVFSEDINESFEKYRGDTVSVNVFKENIIARELFIAHSNRLGLDEERDVLRLLHERARSILYTEWLEYSQDLVELDSSLVIEFWENMGTGISYTGFFHEDSTVMDSVLAMVKNGEHLSRFAFELSERPMTRETRGQITQDEINYVNKVDLEYVLNTEVGDIVDPFFVGDGWRMLQIDSIWIYTPESFEVASLDIEVKLLAAARKARITFLRDSLGTALNVQYNTDALNLMSEHTDADGTTFTTFEPSEEDLIVVSWDGGSRTIYSVTQNIQLLPNYLPRATGDILWLTDYAETLALFDIGMDEGIRLGFDTIPEIARKIERKQLEVILDKYFEVVLEPRLVLDSIALNDVYQEIKNDHFIEENRVYHVLLLDDASMVAAAEGIMASGEDILASSDQFEIFPPILATGEGTRTIPLEKSMIPEEVSEELYSLAPGGETIIVLSDSTVLWFRQDSIIDEHIASLEEISGIVTSEAKQRIETQTIEVLVDSLSDEYHPLVDEEYFEMFYIPVETDSIETDSISNSESALEVI